MVVFHTCNDDGVLSMKITLHRQCNGANLDPVANVFHIFLPLSSSISGLLLLIQSRNHISHRKKGLSTIIHRYGKRMA